MNVQNKLYLCRNSKRRWSILGFHKITFFPFCIERNFKQWQITFISYQFITMLYLILNGNYCKRKITLGNMSKSKYHMLNLLISLKAHLNQFRCRIIRTAFSLPNKNLVLPYNSMLTNNSFVNDKILYLHQLKEY